MSRKRIKSVCFLGKLYIFKKVNLSLIVDQNILVVKKLTIEITASMQISESAFDFRFEMINFNTCKITTKLKNIMLTENVIVRKLIS